MRKVMLRMNEQEKYEIIKELSEHEGNKNNAALKLGITRHQVNILIRKYKEKGKSRLYTWEPLKETSQKLRTTFLQ